MDCCCEHDRGAATDADSPTRNLTPAAGWLKKIIAGMQWAAPVCAFALVLKCPACVAGYVLLFTGIGISTTAASALRWGWMAMCGVALVFLLLRVCIKGWARPSKSGS